MVPPHVSRAMRTGLVTCEKKPAVSSRNVSRLILCLRSISSFTGFIRYVVKLGGFDSG